MGEVASNLWGGVKALGGAIGKGVGSIVDGLSGATGQAASGSVGSTMPALSQSVPALADVAGKAGSSFLSPSAFGSGPIADVMSKIGTPVTDGLTKYATPDILSTIAPNAAKAASGGGFNLSSLLKYAAPAYSVYNAVSQHNAADKRLDVLRGQADTMQASAAPMRADATILNRGAAEAMQGRLPGQAMSAIQQALESAKATIRSSYADKGLSGSTMEAQDIADAQRRAVASQFQIGNQMAQTGFNAAANMGSAAGNIDANSLNLYRTILDAESKEDTEFGNALAGFASLLIKPSQLPKAA